MLTRALLMLHVLTTIAAVVAYKPSVVFPVHGNVFPNGNYNVTINIGNPPKEYTLDIDTGSDLTWLQCGIDDAKTTPTPNDLYMPVISADGRVSNAASCMHYEICEGPDLYCHYEIEYVFENVSLPLTNGTMQTALVAIGCGYDQELLEQVVAPYVDGILGLGRGKAGIMNQLESFGVMSNIIGHCFGAQGGGFLAFGDSPRIDDDSIVWISIPSQIDQYMMGSAKLFFGDEVSPASEDLNVIFDSGSTYTYFSSQAYWDVVTKIKANLGTLLEIANDDPTLPLCWKGDQPFTDISEANSTYFKALHLSMEHSRFEMEPKSYLIISGKGNLCLGILDGGGVGIGDDITLIGDISMLDKWIIYDNEYSRVGWAAANCSDEPQF